jgi:oxygen-dependent protoporphyrinogen oxidase
VNPSSESPKRVAVIGGGISGLAAAQRLVELDPRLHVTLLEAGPSLGGVLQTVRRDGFLIERSADNFVSEPPWAVDLCARIGFADQLIATSSRERRAMVVRRGRLRHLPAGFSLMAPTRIWPLVTTRVLSPLGKLRLLAEYFVRPRTNGPEETLGAFARRRLGREAFDRIVQPLVGGIYTADPEKLSLRATLPRFIDMERRYGSLIRGARRQGPNVAGEGSDELASGARYGLFVAPREGLASLVEAIARRLPHDSLRVNAPVEAISRLPDDTWQIRLPADRTSPASIAADALIFAVGAHCAAPLLAQIDAPLADSLARIPYAGSVVVSLGYRRDSIAHRLDGFGFVVPAVEKRQILAGSFASVKFAGRAPDGNVLIRVFIGGACQSELLELDDDRLRELATSELRSLLGTNAAPVMCDIARWPASMPQYHLGHCELVESIERRAVALPNFALAGNAYHGVGIPNCIHSGEQAAERVCAALQAR